MMAESVESEPESGRNERSPSTRRDVLSVRRANSLTAHLASPSSTDRSHQRKPSTIPTRRSTVATTAIPGVRGLRRIGIIHRAHVRKLSGRTRYGRGQPKTVAAVTHWSWISGQASPAASVVWFASVTLPPPEATSDVTATPLKGLPLGSLTRTAGATGKTVSPTRFAHFRQRSRCVMSYGPAAPVTGSVPGPPHDVRARSGTSRKPSCATVRGCAIRSECSRISNSRSEMSGRAHRV
jgi:hypothetical protein